MPPSAPITGFDPASPAWRESFLRDPYPTYRLLRDAGRPAWLPHEQAESQTAGVWLFSRHAEALAILQDVTHLSKDISRVRPPGQGTFFDHHMLVRDGADHLRLRRLVTPWFSDAAVLALEPVLRACAEGLVARLAGRDVCDLVADFAEPLPLLVIARVLGLPDADMPVIRSSALVFSAGFDSLLAGEPGNQPARAAGMRRFHGYLEQRIANVGELAPDSAIRRLVAVRDEGAMTHEELLAMIGLLAFAGHETTISLIASGAALLLGDRPQRERLMARPELLPTAVEEMLRYESPAQRTTFRTVVAAVEIGGHALEPGEQVGAIIGSANRDEEVFADGERFDIARDPNPHLAFGSGGYACIGRTLARTETRIALATLLAAFPGMELAGTPRWRRNSFFRALEALPVRLGPRA